MRLVEFRNPLPMTVEEYNIAQRVTVAEMSKVGQSEVSFSFLICNLATLLHLFSG